MRKCQRHNLTVVSVQTTQFLAGARVPKAYGPVLAPGGEQTSGRSEGEGAHAALPGQPAAPQLAAKRIPKPNDIVIAGGGQQPAVRSEGQQADAARVGAKTGAFLAGGHLPEPDPVAVAHGSQRPAVGGKGECFDETLCAPAAVLLSHLCRRNAEKFLALAYPPDFQRAVQACGDDQFLAGRESERGNVLY